MVQLICEGRCNPNLEVADNLAKAYAAAKQRSVGFDLTEDMIRVQRSLVYTDHTYVNRGECRCVQCGTTRQYGLR
jgi:hypothetical protein